MIQLKRAYEPPSKSDGHRILVDRVWPRGISKEDLKLDSWEKDLAPSTSLRKWFGHDPEKWEEFQKRYREELKGSEALQDLANRAKKEKITLVFGAKDETHSNAAALKAILGTFRS